MTHDSRERSLKPWDLSAFVHVQVAVPLVSLVLLYWAFSHAPQGGEAVLWYLAYPTNTLMFFWSLWLGRRIWTQDRSQVRELVPK